MQTAERHVEPINTNRADPIARAQNIVNDWLRDHPGGVYFAHPFSREATELVRHIAVELARLNAP